MKITYLGTAAAEGFPAMFCKCEACIKAKKLGGKNIRTRSQAMINDDLLIDFPPDTYSHFLNSNFDSGLINNILITHTHEDHLYLQDFFMRRPGFTDYDKGKALNVFGNDSLLKQVVPFKDESFFDGFSKNTTFNELQEFEEANVGNYLVTPLLANHDKTEKCFIYMINDGKKRILYAHDTGYFPEKTFDYIKNFYFDYISFDCNHMMDINRDNHMGLSTCIEVKDRMIAENMADDKTVFMLNHFSHNSRILHDEFVNIARKDNFLVSFDGCEINI